MVYRLQVDDSSSALTSNTTAIHAFIILNLIGGIGMLLVLLTALIFREVKRLATWYSFCFSWTLSAMSYSLLFFSGDQMNPNPIYSVCYVQAALIYAVPPTTTSTTLALLVQILLSLPDSTPEERKVISLRTACMLVMAPYTIFLIIFIGVAVFQTDNPDTLQRATDGTYCNSSNESWYRVSFSLVAGLSLIIVVVQIRLAMRLYSSIRPSKLKDNTQWIRAMAFTLIGLVTLITAMIFAITNDRNIAFDLILSTFPVLALLVFGTQKDLICAWFRWKRPHLPRGRGSVMFGRDFVGLQEP